MTDTPERHPDWRLWDELTAEMTELLKLPHLTTEQAERWASLCGTRAALYVVPPDEPEHKAIRNTITGTWHLIPMHRNRTTPNETALTSDDDRVTRPSGFFGATP